MVQKLDPESTGYFVRCKGLSKKEFEELPLSYGDLDEVKVTPGNGVSEIEIHDRRIFAWESNKDILYKIKEKYGGRVEPSAPNKPLALEDVNIVKSKEDILKLFNIYEDFKVYISSNKVSQATIEQIINQLPRDKYKIESSNIQVKTVEK